MVGTQETFVKRKTDQQRKRKERGKAKKRKEEKEKDRNLLEGRKGKIRVGIKLLQL